MPSRYVTYSSFNPKPCRIICVFTVAGLINICISICTSWPRFCPCVCNCREIQVVVIATYAGLAVSSALLPTSNESEDLDSGMSPGQLLSHHSHLF